jgi:glycosyltransferase involved in cell wall biosynthesis
MWEEFLQRLPDLGVDVQLLIPWKQNNYSLRRILSRREKFAWIGLDYFYWPQRIFSEMGMRRRILDRRCLRKGADVFHSTYFSTLYNEKVAKVVTVYDMIFERSRSAFDPRWIDSAIASKKQALFNADVITAISHSTKLDLLKIYPQIPDEKIVVIPLAVDFSPETHPADFAEVASRYSLARRTGEYLLYVGNRGEYKNFDIIPRWLKSGKGRDAFIVCVGGESSEMEQARLRSQGVADLFHFISYAPDPDLRILLQNAQALLFTSRYEGFGLPILEAMANDCPVICSDIAVFHEVAGDAAIYFDPLSPDALTQAVTRLTGDKSREMITRGRKNVDRFSWDDSAKALLAVYKSLSDRG